MHPNYQLKWRAKNSNKVKDYQSKEKNQYVLDKKYPELPFIWKHKQKKESKLVEQPCQSCSKHTIISISKLLKKKEIQFFAIFQLQFIAIPAFCYMQNQLNQVNHCDL